MKNLKYLLEDYVKNKARVSQLYLIGSLLQEKGENRLFLKLDSRYADYFTEYSSYFVRALMLLKYMHEMTNSGNLFADELIE